MAVQGVVVLHGMRKTRTRGRRVERGWGNILGIELRSQSWEPASLKQTVREKNYRTAR